MRGLILTPKFRRAYRKFAKNDRTRPKRIDDILTQMSQDVFAGPLGTHKLSGELSSFWACSCGYDCRIIFALEVDAKTGQEVILLLDIGTHDEVY